MPDNEFENEPTDDRDAAGLTPAERRVMERENAESKRELAIFKAGLGDLNDDQRAALIAVTKDDLTPDTLKAKAEALFGAPKQEETPPPPAEQTQVLSGEQRIADAAQGSTPPPPPTSKLADLRQKVETMPIGALMRGDLQQEAIEAIQAAGLVFGNVEHSSEFTPLSLGK